MLVATFGPTTAWAGKRITYESGLFTLEGLGPISAQDVLEYDRQGHIGWAYHGLREWVSEAAGQTLAPAPTAVPAAPTVPAVAAAAAPVEEPKRRSVFWPVLGALVVFFILIPVVAFAGCAGCAACGAGTAVVTSGSDTTPAATPKSAKPASKYASVLRRRRTTLTTNRDGS
jgi:hypothetical protein